MTFRVRLRKEMPDPAAHAPRQALSIKALFLHVDLKGWFHLGRWALYFNRIRIGLHGHVALETMQNQLNMPRRTPILP